MNQFVATLTGICFCLSLSLNPVAAEEKGATKKEGKEVKVETDVVKLKNLKLKVPKTWEKAKSSSSMRLATYQVKPVEGEQDKAELTVFNFPNQDIKQNIDRWVSQFQATGRKAKTTKGTCSTGEYYLVEASGIFKKPDPNSPPFLRKTTDAPDYRMLGVILPVEGSGMYFLKLTGPDKTVHAQAKAFRASFGGDLKNETELK